MMYMLDRITHLQDCVFYCSLYMCFMQLSLKALVASYLIFDGYYFHYLLCVSSSVFSHTSIEIPHQTHGVA